ncbi:uncharacterized protein LOC106639708 [Copidosoma floridanum]|uniref:uncharacterized protein LOC106639708 n=1 Tax=Copidosoma floridanum TaxID=29053 RepID=UPI0006C9C7A0|nr:uncharacterized protein LOC106639708 [Copidosoma floridanum]
MDVTTPMKLDAIEISPKKLTFRGCENAVKDLRKKLRKFFNEADGHGSLLRKPPSRMITPQYFITPNVISCYPIKRMDWIAFVNVNNYKKCFSPSDDAVLVQRSHVLMNTTR